ncbi:MAG TPA: restriction endonuclease [Gaiellaceae bacterium]|jgi:HJR/Mrr/RecB family endonuclease|nr:restriction endonuclease [Gaiellaceae bacterium]
MRPEPKDLFRHLDALDGRDFEDVVASLLSQDGYEVAKTEYYDRGADLIATKDGVRWAIQVKRWNGPVREDAVRAVLAGKMLYGCDRARVITNSTFTKRASSTAKQLEIDMWDRARLVREIQWFCATCGTRVTPRVKRWCLDHTEQFHGKVYCFVHQQQG